MVLASQAEPRGTRRNAYLFFFNKKKWSHEIDGEIWLRHSVGYKSFRQQFAEACEVLGQGARTRGPSSHAIGEPMWTSE